MSARPDCGGGDDPFNAAAHQELVGRSARLSKPMAGGDLVRCKGKDPDGNPFSVSDRP